MIGAFAAMQAIRIILDGKTALGDPQWGKLHLFEGLVPSLRTMRIAKDPECRGCSAQ
jgi:molybdopterin-synthase adenylyltransferase